MSNYTMEELQGFLDQVNERLEDIAQKLHEAEDFMDESGEQSALQARYESLIEKGMNIQDQMNELHDAELSAMGEVDLDDYYD